MKFETKIISIVLILCMVAGVFINARSDESIFEEFSFFSNKTTLRLWYTDDAITPYLQSISIKFAESNRDVRVEPKLVSGMEYLEAVNKASVENKNFPDLFITTNDTLEKVYCAGLALEADNSDGFFNKVLFPKAALDSVTYKGKYIAYPFYFETSALVYNKTYLEAYAKTLMEQNKQGEGGEDAANAGGSEEETVEAEQAQTEASTEASSDEAKKESSQDEAGEESSTEGEEGAEGEEGTEGEEGSEEDAFLNDEEISSEELDEKVKDILSSEVNSIQDIIDFSRKYEAPNKVESVFKWDVTDIFYNYFFIIMFFICIILR